MLPVFNFFRESRATTVYRRGHRLPGRPPSPDELLFPGSPLFEDRFHRRQFAVERIVADSARLRFEVIGERADALGVALGDGQRNRLLFPLA